MHVRRSTIIGWLTLALAALAPVGLSWGQATPAVAKRLDLTVRDAKGAVMSDTITLASTSAPLSLNHEVRNAHDCTLDVYANGESLSTKIENVQSLASLAAHSDHPWRPRSKNEPSIFTYSCKNSAGQALSRTIVVRLAKQ